MIGTEHPEVRKLARSRHGRFALLVALVAAASGCAAGGGVAAGPEPDPVALEYAESLGVDFSRMEELDGGLWVEVLTEGVGRQAMQGRQTLIHYVGYLPDGTVVDSSLGGDPFSFELGDAAVIRGWNLGIAGMKVGGRRRFVIRPGLAYGSRGRSPTVPPQSVLVFEIQLIDVR